MLKTVAVDIKSMDLHELFKVGASAQDVSDAVQRQICKRLAIEDSSLVESAISGLLCLCKPCNELSQLDIDRVVKALREGRNPDDDLLYGPKPGSRAIMAIHKDDPQPQEWARAS